MNADLVVRPPFARAEIVAELTRLAAEVTTVAERFDVEAFFAPQREGDEEKWSPAQQLRHLTRSTRPLARGMALPRLMLALRFGVKLRPVSSDYAAVQARYDRLLATRPSAGRFAPDPDGPGADGARRQEILRRWNDAAAQLAIGIERWPERALDRYRAPHPRMGMQTIRELLFFTLYHTSHHGRQLARRAVAGAPTPPRVGT